MTKHVETEGTDLGRLEAIGALNFLDLDDISVLDEGEPIDPLSIIIIPMREGWPDFPKFERSPRDPFLRQLDASGKKWVIFVDLLGHPYLVLNAHHFLRDVLFENSSVSPEAYWHQLTPRNAQATLSHVQHPLGPSTASSNTELANKPCAITNCTVFKKKARVGGDHLARPPGRRFKLSFT